MYTSCSLSYYYYYMMPSSIPCWPMNDSISCHVVMKTMQKSRMFQFMSLIRYISACLWLSYIYIHTHICVYMQV